MPYRRTDNVIRKQAARHSAIIESARLIAAEGGMAAVQIAPVAERAGIAAGTVYRYFPSKTELVGALIAAIAEREIGAMRRAADAAPGPVSALAAAIATFAARALRNRQAGLGGDRRAGRCRRSRRCGSSTAGRSPTNFANASTPRWRPRMCRAQDTGARRAGSGRRAARRPDRSAGAAILGRTQNDARAAVQTLTLLSLARARRGRCARARPRGADRVAAGGRERA